MRRNLTTSQLFARFLTFCHLFSTTLISVHLILTLLNSQLFSARIDSSHLSSTHPIFFLARLKWHKCKLVQLPSLSFDPFGSFAFVLWHRGVFTQRICFALNKFLHREIFTPSKLSHWEVFTQSKLLHRGVFPQRSFYTDNLLHRMRQNRENFADKAAFATFMQPLQYDLRLSAAKYNSITHAAGAARNLNRGIPLRPANTESKNTM